MLFALPRLLPVCGTGTWVGQVCWALWESKHRVQRGESQSAHSSRPPSPTAPVRALPGAPPSPGKLSSSPRAGLPHCLYWQRCQQLLQELWLQPWHEPCWPRQGLEQWMVLGTHTVPIPPPWQRPQHFTSAPCLHLQLHTRLYQAALLLDELVEGGVQGSFVIWARLLPAGTQTRSPGAGLGPGPGDWSPGKAGAPAPSPPCCPVPAAGAAVSRGIPGPNVRGRGWGRRGQGHTHPSLSVSSGTRRVKEGGRDIPLRPNRSRRRRAPSDTPS